MTPSARQEPETSQKPSTRALAKERLKLLQNLESALQKPMMLLGFVWLLLIILQFVVGSTAAISDLTVAIWIVFIVDFVVRFALATKKIRFLRRNLLIAVSLILPALRVLQLGRIFMMIPSWQVPLLQMLGGMNRSLMALQATMQRRGLGYVVALTAAVTFAGAAAMYHFENHPGGPGLNTYGSALWWTAMVMTTLGSDYFPHSVGGRILCFLLAVFAFSIFGYITAAIASYFVNQDAGDARSPIPNEATLVQLVREVKALREQVTGLEAPRA